VSQQQKQVNLVRDGKHDHPISDMGSMSIEDEKHFLATLFPSLRLRDKAILKPLGTEGVTCPPILGCCNAAIWSVHIWFTHQISGCTSMFADETDFPENTKPSMNAVPSALQHSITVTSSRSALHRT